MARHRSSSSTLIASLPSYRAAASVLPAPHERRALDDFRELRDRVERAKAQVRKPRTRDITGGDVDRPIDGLQSLARSDPAAYRRLRSRLLGGLGAELTKG